MKRKQLLVVLGLMGVLGLATGCKDQVALDAAKAAQADADAVRISVTKIDGYLRDNYIWLLYATAAVCQLEDNNKRGLNPDMRICTGSPPDVKSPPVYPPK